MLSRVNSWISSVTERTFNFRIEFHFILPTTYRMTFCGGLTTIYNKSFMNPVACHQHMHTRYSNALEPRSFAICIQLITIYFPPNLHFKVGRCVPATQSYGSESPTIGFLLAFCMDR